jgi:CRP-like cAMP-binding protein
MRIAKGISNRFHSFIERGRGNLYFDWSNPVRASFFGEPRILALIGRWSVNMNRYLSKRETEQSNSSNDNSLALPLLLLFSNGKCESKELISDLSCSFESEQFQLSDLIFSLPDRFTNNVIDEQNKESFYLVCQGKIRLLSFDPEKRRDVPTQLLSEGEIFGSDNLFFKMSLPYKAIAATDSTCVARISTQQLKLQLEQLSELKNQWFDEAQKRQALIVFKTLSEWRSRSSSRLQNLVPYHRNIK